MESHVNFEDLVHALQGTGLKGKKMTAFGQVETTVTTFVNPELLVKEGLKDLTAEIILISARGAAGKSTAASELARKIDSPLWKLEDDKAISGTSLDFALSQYLGITDLDAYLDGKKPTIIIDSLDEARSRVSGTSWTEFLESLSNRSRSSCRFVLLGRERTLEEVWLNLAEAGRTIAWLEISHFGPEERIRYIDGVVSRRRPEAVKSKHYAPARDAVLNSLVGAVPDETAQAFAGYAPVLDAVAAALQDNANLYSIPAMFGESNQDARHLKELVRILVGLLERDQKKLQPVASDLGLDPKSTYTPDEQIDWLCYDLAGGSKPELANICKPEIREKYIERVRPFLDDHPFRDENRWASAVFRAFVAAQRFGTTIYGRRLLDVGNESGLLFDFVTLDSKDDPIDEWQLAALHASVTAGEFSGTSAAVTASEGRDGLFKVSIYLRRLEDQTEVSFTLIPDQTGEVQLYGPLEGLTLETNGSVSIPNHGTSVVLGPDLFIRCENLSIEGGSVEFAHRGIPTSKDTTLGGVTLAVGSGLRLPMEIARWPLAGDFELQVPSETNLVHPWVLYRHELPAEDNTVDTNARAVRFLNMLMNLTRSHGHSGDRGVFIMKLQGRQSIKGGELQSVLSILESRGIIRTEGPMLFLDPGYEKHRFSGKTRTGQRLIENVWDIWGPVVAEIDAALK